MAEQVARAYRRVLDELRGQILAGDLREGERLPSVRAITERFGVTTGTAARAIAELRAEGLVITRQGAGVFVRRFKAIRRSSPARLAADRRVGGAMIQNSDTDQRPRTVDVEVGEVSAADWITTALGLDSGKPVEFRSRRFLVEERPVQLATSYLPPDLARGTAIMHTNPGPGGIYARLADAGHSPQTFTEYVRGRMPVPDERKRLELPDGTPVLEITRHAYDQDGRCVEVNRMILDATAYVIDYTFPAQA